MCVDVCVVCVDVHVACVDVCVVCVDGLCGSMACVCSVCM